jgi:hypothetical protein
MNKKVLLYGGIGLGVIALGIVGYLISLKMRETRSTTEANANNNSSNMQPSGNTQQGVTIGQSMLPPALQGMTQAQINALISGGRQV